LGCIYNVGLITLKIDDIFMKRLLFLIAALTLVQVGFAQEEKEAIAQPADSYVEQIRLASRLAKYGYEESVASALIEAAAILNRIPNFTGAPESYVAGDGGLGVAKTADRELTVEQLLKDAKELAADDAVLMEMANRIASGPSRGAANGCVLYTTEIVKANATDTYRVRLASNELTEIMVSGDGDTDLDLYIYDENGNFIDSDTDYTDDCYCCVCPKWTGYFTVKVVNRGNVYNRYLIIVK